MDTNIEEIKPDQLGRLLGGISAAAADELIDSINDLARELGARWAFERILNIDGSPHSYVIHPGLYEIVRQEPDFLGDLVARAAQ